MNDRNTWRLVCCAFGCQNMTSMNEGYSIYLPVKATWKYPTWGNLMGGVKDQAVAIICDSCGKAKRKLTEICLVIEFTDEGNVCHHLIDWHTSPLGETIVTLK